MENSGFVLYELPKWIEVNRSDFQPPVCNKNMFNDQLKVFLVGGPNKRKDFHLEEGEEFFFQIKGDMCLLVVENGAIKDIRIKEGQRFLNTIGLVAERTRAPWEFDSLRYLVEGTTQILFERWVHLNDVVKDLPPIMKEYLGSEAHHTGAPTADSVIPSRPFDADPAVRVAEPIQLDDWIRSHGDEIMKLKTLQLYGPPTYKSHVKIHGAGLHNIGSRSGDTFLYAIKADMTVIADDGAQYELRDKSVLRLPASRSAALEISSGYALSVYMETPTDKPEIRIQ